MNGRGEIAGVAAGTLSALVVQKLVSTLIIIHFLSTRFTSEGIIEESLPKST